MMNAFDVTQFKHNTDSSYQYETNHAFFPLFSYLVHHLSKILAIDRDIAGAVFQLILGYLTSVILYT